MSIAALLVSSKGRVLHMNQRAATYLQRADCLHLQQGKLTAIDPLESARLEMLIAGAASDHRNVTKPPTSVESMPGGAMTISRPHTQIPVQVTVIPTPEHNQIAGSESSALVFISDPSSSPRPRAALMRQLYGLTPAESRLADLLMGGLEVRDGAERLHITLGTARFHLKRVLEKTGVHRQTELMRLMISLPGSS